MYDALRRVEIAFKGKFFRERFEFHDRLTEKKDKKPPHTIFLCVKDPVAPAAVSHACFICG